MAGAGKALIESWKDVQGKIYNPQLLKRWLALQTAAWPKQAAKQVELEYAAGLNPGVAVDVLLHFQPRTR